MDINDQISSASDGHYQDDPDYSDDLILGKVEHSDVDITLELAEVLLGPGCCVSQADKNTGFNRNW